MMEKTLEYSIQGVRILGEENFKINYARSKNFLTVKVREIIEKNSSLQVFLKFFNNKNKQFLAYIFRPLTLSATFLSICQRIGSKTNKV